MLILNSLTLFVQIVIVILVSVASMNILKYFSKTTATKMAAAAAAVAPAIFVPHGGGPLPLLGGDDYKGLNQFLKHDIHKHIDLSKVKAIILVTAHWEENVVSISSSKKHDLYFDYYGFPPETYKYRYPAPGAPELALKVYEKVTEAGFQARLDPKRGWDHGVFVPMLLVHPKADIPIVQVSVLSHQDPAKHFELGRALYDLRKEGVAVFGSGMSYHNMREFMSMYSNNDRGVVNEPFDDFLNEACSSDEAERKEALASWRRRPGANEAHPLRAAEHLMPLIVAAGAGGPDKGRRILNWDLESKFRLSSFLWREESDLS